MVADELVVSRVLHAPRELVWRAWTDPDQLVRWWGKHGWRARRESVTLDVRPGGAFALVSVHEADGTEMAQAWTFMEVLAPERLVLARVGDEAARTVATFTDLGDGRTALTVRASGLRSAALRDRATGGLASALDRLAEHLDHHHPKEPA